MPSVFVGIAASALVTTRRKNPRRKGRKEYSLRRQTRAPRFWKLRSPATRLRSWPFLARTARLRSFPVMR